MGQGLAGVAQATGGVRSEHAGVHEKGMTRWCVEDGREGAEVVVVFLRHRACDVVMPLEELPRLRDLFLPHLVFCLSPELGEGQLVFLVVIIVLLSLLEAVRVRTIDAGEPLAPAGKGLDPASPCPPLDDLLVVVASDADDVVGGQEREHGERAFESASGDDVAEVDQGVRSGVISKLGKQITVK